MPIDPVPNGSVIGPVPVEMARIASVRVASGGSLQEIGLGLVSGLGANRQFAVFQGTP
jgi:hypothetical protein